MKLDTKLVPVKAIYFVTLAGLACLIPFLPVYMHHLGLTAVEIGIIRGLEPIINLVFCPLWGAIADKFHKHKAILIGSLLISGVSLFVTLFIPPVDELTLNPYTESNPGPSLSAAFQNDSNNLSVTTHYDNNWIKNVSFGIGCNATNSYDLLSAFCKNFYFYGDSNMILTDVCPDICHASELHMDKTMHQEYATDKRSNQTYESVQNQTYDCHICLKQRKQYLSNGLAYGWGFEIKNPLFFESECHPLVHHSKLETTISNQSSLCAGIENTTECPTPLSYAQTSTHSTECMESFQCICLPHLMNAEEIKKSSHSVTFTLMLFFVLFAKMFNCNVFPMLDSTVMELLPDARKDYSKQKMWGTVGWASFALVTGAIIDGISYTTKTLQLSPAFYLYLVFMFASACVTGMLMFPPHTSNQTLLLHSFGLLRQPTITTFLLLVFVLGFSFGIIGTFLFLYLEELGGLYTLMGLTLTVTCISEIPVFFFSGHLVKFFGHLNVLYLTLLCYAIRLLGYSFLRNPWVVIPIELLHGITYGAAWATCSGYANVCAPPGMGAHLQSLFSATHMGLGKGLGTLFGGLVYHWFGGRNLFRISAGLCLLSAITFFLLQNFVIKKGLRYSRFHEICDGSDRIDESREESGPTEFDRCRLEIEESDFNSCSVDAHAMQLALGTITDFPDSDDPSDPSSTSAIEMSSNGKHPSWQEDDDIPIGTDIDSPGTSSLSSLLKLEGRLPAIGREDSSEIVGAERLPAVGEDYYNHYDDDDTTTLILPHGGKSTTV